MNFIIGAAGGQIPNPEEYTRRYASQQGKSIDEAKQYLNVQGVDNNQSSIIGGTSIWMDGKQEKPNKKQTDGISLNASYPYTMDFSQEILPPEPIDGQNSGTFSWFNKFLNGGKNQEQKTQNDEQPKEFKSYWG